VFDFGYGVDFRAVMVEVDCGKLDLFRLTDFVSQEVQSRVKFIYCMKKSMHFSDQVNKKIAHMTFVFIDTVHIVLEVNSQIINSRETASI
jgi:hypothetical protein